MTDVPAINPQLHGIRILPSAALEDEGLVAMWHPAMSDTLCFPPELFQRVRQSSADELRELVEQIEVHTVKTWSQRKTRQTHGSTT